MTKELNQHIRPISALYQDWFLDYASYVILERAVPNIEDGLKPVQRRILHSMKEMDDGRFNKVANIIGQTMQYHPHGDMSIGDALVALGQKDLLIDMQGNWGDIRTGDSAAAARYIEARPSKFALDVAFNADTTQWQLSYDGRKREPIALPMKFPLLLAQGVEGIAVGLSTKILPHNFCELIEASIAHLKKKPFQLFPDFQTGGFIDVSSYNDGKRGSKVRVRAKIEEWDKKTLIIKQIPFNTTTSSLIDSIVKANDNGKIKIKKVTDNTAKDVEIEIQLAPNVSPDVTIDALYAFTDCEISISPSACIIVENKPRFVTVSDLLKTCTDQTLALLELELDIKLKRLEESWHFASLEKIFIEKRIYRDIETCETWASVLATIERGLEPFKALFWRAINVEDILKLTEIKIKRISKFDAFKADEYLKNLEDEIKSTKKNIKEITNFTVHYFENLLKKYGKNKQRQTQIRTFDTIVASNVVVANQKLYVNRIDGFAGFGLKKDELVCDCSDIDDIIVFRKDGRMLVTKISDKAFLGKDIIYIDVWRKNDERMTYNFIYTDGKTGINYLKRFNVTAITRDKEYDLTQGEKGSKVLYFTANPNSESELINVQLSQNCTAKVKVFDFNFADIAIKGRTAMGNILTKYPIKKIQFKHKGKSTVGGRNIWFDDTVGRLNVDERGRFLGSFDSGDALLCIYKDGTYELTNFELSNRYEMAAIALLEKLDTQKPIACVYFSAAHAQSFVKRFVVETTTFDKRFTFIDEEKGSKMHFVSTQNDVRVNIKIGKKKDETELQIHLDSFIDVKGWKSIGNKLTDKPINAVERINNNDTAENEPQTTDRQTIKPKNEATNPTRIETQKTNPKPQNPKSKTTPNMIEVGQTIEFEINPNSKNTEQLDMFGK